MNAPTFKSNQTVYLPDGREAIYVMQNGDQHLVRIVREVEDSEVGPYSYPDDKITDAAKVYASAPVDVWDKQVLAKREQVLELDRELIAKRREIADAAKNKAEMEKAAAKYPCIQQALDFIEGRITHVVSWDTYGGAKIETLQDALTQNDTWGGRRTYEGMKLLNLFGTDEKGRSVAWGVNQYRDGSGSSSKQIWPAYNEGHAMQIVSGLVFDAIDAWRAGDENWWKGRPNVDATLKANPWLTAPDDWLDEQAKRVAQQRADKIAKLRAEIEKLEGKP